MLGRASQIAVVLIVMLATMLLTPASLTTGSTAGTGAYGPDAIQRAEGVVPQEAGIGAATGPIASSGSVTVRATVVARAAQPSMLIYRFYSPKSGTHFYTPSAEERDMVMVGWPDVWHYEGIAYTVNPKRNSQPLYRFYNRANGSHFYTASAAERDMVFAKWMNVFTYDGPTYAVTPHYESGKTPVYRFFNKKNGSHFYTASAEEANNVLVRWPHIYHLEGFCFWLGQ